MGEHPGLARAGAGHHQQRAAVVHDRIELVRVERIQVERDAAIGSDARRAGS